MSTNFTDVMKKCVVAVQDAGDFQLKHFRTMPAGYGDEKDVREMVSFVDVESEKILKINVLGLTFKFYTKTKM